MDWTLDLSQDLDLDLGLDLELDNNRRNVLILYFRIHFSPPTIFQKAQRFSESNNSLQSAKAIPLKQESVAEFQNYTLDKTSGEG